MQREGTTGHSRKGGKVAKKRRDAECQRKRQMQYLGHTDTRKLFVCLSEVQIELGVLYLIWKS